MSPIEYIIQHVSQDVTILKCVVWVFVGIVIGKIIAEIYFAYKD